jgi:hypothetical protein
MRDLSDARHNRRRSLIAAAGIAALLWMNAPVMAAELDLRHGPGGVYGRPGAFLHPHHATPRGRLLAARRLSPVRYAEVAPAPLPDCSEAWCGRQFVLMVGVGF